MLNNDATISDIMQTIAGMVHDKRREIEWIGRNYTDWVREWRIFNAFMEVEEVEMEYSDAA